MAARVLPAGFLEAWGALAHSRKQGRGEALMAELAELLRHEVTAYSQAVAREDAGDQAAVEQIAAAAERVAAAASGLGAWRLRDQVLALAQKAPHAGDPEKGMQNLIAMQDALEEVVHQLGRLAPPS